MFETILDVASIVALLMFVASVLFSVGLVVACVVLKD